MNTDQHAQIIDILDRTADMTVATVRPDGFPQATVVSYVHDDLTIYFMTVTATQKARNIQKCDKVSMTMTPPYDNWNVIEGLSMGGHASVVTDPKEKRRVEELMTQRFPMGDDMEIPETVELVYFRIDPVVVSILDYRKGFGHTETLEVQPLLAASG